MILSKTESLVFVNSLFPFPVQAAAKFSPAAGSMLSILPSGYMSDKVQQQNISHQVAKQGWLDCHLPFVKSGKGTGAFRSIEIPESSTIAVITAES